MLLLLQKGYQHLHPMLHLLKSLLSLALLLRPLQQLLLVLPLLLSLLLLVLLLQPLLQRGDHQARSTVYCQAASAAPEP